jgi:hypothetical protein
MADKRVYLACRARRLAAMRSARKPIALLRMKKPRRADESKQTEHLLQGRQGGHQIKTQAAPKAKLTYFLL